MREPVALFRRTHLLPLLLALVVSAALFACSRRPHPRDVPGGDAERGREAIKKFACGACHVIPGVEGAVGRESHPLFGFANRGDIAGVAPNTPDNLVKWIRKPTDLLPRTRMPILGVSEQEAKDIATYLYTLNGE
jgi:cytochrome c